MSVTAWRSRLKNAAAVKSSEVGMMLTFRAVTTQDLETVAPLIHRADPFGWTMQNLQSALASGWTVTAAEAEGSIVGCAVVMQVIDEAELLEIAVDPVHQGKGFGKALLAQVLAAARARAVRLMRLEVRIGNERALKMYEKAGFKRVGLRRGYYPTAAGREDAVLMDADLTVR